MMKEYRADLFLDARAVLGEGPVWNQEEGSLYWVDIVRGQIHRFNPASGREEIISAGKTVGAVAPRTNGGLVAALSDGFYLLPDPDFGAAGTNSRITPLCLPEDVLPGQRFNDGKCDPAGRFWAGTMQLGADSPGCALYCLEPDGRCRTMAQGIGCSNGLAWTKDGKTLYYIDTLTRCVDAFDFDAATGGLSARRSVIDFTSSGADTSGSPAAGLPDGMTIDKDGMLWVAEWTGYKVSRWNPSTARKIGEVILPVSKVTSCAFGGPEYSKLYITTASEGLSLSEKTDQPFCGGIFCAETDTNGFAPVPFAG